jgi:3'(2'), 5'-bisphosphate nucleotidase
MNDQSLLSLAITAAEKASVGIMDVYESGDFQAEVKGDNSPLTIADKRAHGVIVDGLKASGLPVLSEEGATVPYEERKQWTRFWMVDPLDGTKEFLKRNGEFTVNIALIERGEPVMGVVAVPVSGDVYYSSEGQGAFLQREGKVTRLLRRERVNLSKSRVKVVASRSHMNAETHDFLSQLKDPELVSQGSSLKFMLLAEGKADIYPRFAPTMEWDTAAAHAVVKETGLVVREVGTQTELSYNKASLLNPYFICS